MEPAKKSVQPPTTEPTHGVVIKDTLVGVDKTIHEIALEVFTKELAYIEQCEKPAHTATKIVTLSEINHAKMKSEARGVNPEFTEKLSKMDMNELGENLDKLGSLVQSPDKKTVYTKEGISLRDDPNQSVAPRFLTASFYENKKTYSNELDNLVVFTAEVHRVISNPQIMNTSKEEKVKITAQLDNAIEGLETLKKLYLNTHSEIQEIQIGSAISILNTAKLNLSNQMALSESVERRKVMKEGLTDLVGSELQEIYTEIARNLKESGNSENQIVGKLGYLIENSGLSTDYADKAINSILQITSVPTESKSLFIAEYILRTLENSKSVQMVNKEIEDLETKQKALLNEKGYLAAKEAYDKSPNKDEMPIPLQRESRIKKNIAEKEEELKTLKAQKLKFSEVIFTAAHELQINEGLDNDKAYKSFLEKFPIVVKATAILADIKDIDTLKNLSTEELGINTDLIDETRGILGAEKILSGNATNKVNDVALGAGGVLAAVGLGLSFLPVAPLIAVVAGGAGVAIFATGAYKKAQEGEIQKDENPVTRLQKRHEQIIEERKGLKNKGPEALLALNAGFKAIADGSFLGATGLVDKAANWLKSKAEEEALALAGKKAEALKPAIAAPAPTVAATPIKTGIQPTSPLKKEESGR